MVTFAPDSSVQGYLSSTNAILEDQELDRFIHDLIYGITRLDPTLIRPRWQQEPANLPANGTTWCAFGITNKINDTNASEKFINTGTIITRNQEVDILISCYGTQAGQLDSVFREGISLAQNREHMRLNNIGYVSLSDVRNTSLEINKQWNKRLDSVLRIRRNITRFYPIKDLLSAETNINYDGYVDTVLVTNP